MDDQASGCLKYPFPVNNLIRRVGSFFEPTIFMSEEILSAGKPTKPVHSKDERTLLFSGVVF
jgi:hypothetical protein